MEFTTDTLSQALGVERAIGYGFLRFLEAKGLVENLGVRKVEKQKGKGPTYFRLKPGADQTLAHLLGPLS